MSSLVCVPIMVETVEAALADAHQARVLGADLVEFRIDGFFAGDGDDEGRLGVLQLAAESPVPCIVTCRAADEGGEYEGDESARISLYEALGASDHPPAYLDLEHASFTRSANLRQKALLSVAHAAQPRDLSTGLILSMHDFEARPTDLFTRLAAMREV
ncbi:MAG: type I 3-dehydroquinate dehydratase, partial [Planctomycetota bacterium]